MSTPQAVHNAAMDEASLALDARRTGDNAGELLHFARAYGLEAQAAAMVGKDQEPTYSVLRESSAHLWHDYEQAAKKVAEAQP